MRPIERRCRCALIFAPNPLRLAVLIGLSFTAAACLLGQENQEPKFRRYTKGLLTADDYRAPVPEDRNGLDAYTTTDLQFEFQYRTYRARRRVRAWTTTIDVYAAVDPSSSWNRQLQDKRLMDHEQGHFDLTHIAALQAQHHFAISGRLTSVASGEDQAVANLRQQLDQQIKVFVDELRDKHHEYDKCTRHGLNRSEQDEQRRLQREQITTLTEKKQSQSSHP